MKKYLAFALAFLLTATIFTACGRGTVSNDPHGMITDSVVTTETTKPVDPVPTMTMPTAETTKPSESSVPSEPSDSASDPSESTHPTLTEPVNKPYAAEKTS